MFLIPAVNLVMVLLQGCALSMALLEKIAVESLVTYFPMGTGYLITVIRCQDDLGCTAFGRAVRTIMISPTWGRDPHVAVVGGWGRSWPPTDRRSSPSVQRCCPQAPYAVPYVSDMQSLSNSRRRGMAGDSMFSGGA